MLYALVAVPLLATVLKASLDRSKPLHDVLALGLLAACIVAPYGRHYDFPVLLIPLFVLLGTRLSEIAGAVLLVPHPAVARTPAQGPVGPRTNDWDTRGE